MDLANGKKKVNYDDLLKLAGDPITLSEEEKKRLSEVFSHLRDLLNEYEEELLEAPRDIAFPAAKNLIATIKAATTGEITVTLNTPIITPDQPTEHLKKPDFLEIIKQLPKLYKSYSRRLDCKKNYDSMLDDPDHEADSAICAHCSIEEMKSCIRSELNEDESSALLIKTGEAAKFETQEVPS